MFRKVTEGERISVLRNLQTKQSKKDKFMQWRTPYFVKKEWQGYEKKDGGSLLLIMSRKETLTGELETEEGLG